MCHLPVLDRTAHPRPSDPHTTTAETAPVQQAVEPQPAEAPAAAGTPPSGVAAAAAASGAAAAAVADITPVDDADDDVSVL